MLKAVATLAAAAVITACATPMESAGRDCFLADNVSGWSVIDEDTIAVRVGANDRYALDTITSAEELRWDMGIAVESDTSFVCTGNGITGVEIHSLDPNFRRSWIVTDVTRLPDEGYG